VLTGDGQKGYVHQSFVRLTGEGPAPAPREAVVAKLPVGEKVKPPPSLAPPDVLPTPPTGISKPDAHAAPEDAQPPTTPTITEASQTPPSAAVGEKPLTAQSKSSALIHVLEGREGDMILWLAIAAAFFLIGWICGGNYYLRRDRLRRTKLRF